MRLEIKDLSISHVPIAGKGFFAAGGREDDEVDQCPKSTRDDDDQCRKFTRDDDDQCRRFTLEDDEDDDGCCRMSMGQSVTTGDDDDDRQGQSAAAYLSAHRAELSRLMGEQHSVR